MKLMEGDESDPEGERIAGHPEEEEARPPPPSPPSSAAPPPSPLIDWHLRDDGRPLPSLPVPSPVGATSRESPNPAGATSAAALGGLAPRGRPEAGATTSLGGTGPSRATTGTGNRGAGGVGCGAALEG
ncbi:hypothetical protein PVAP13_5KG259400 [Panicum virgatum]|uniref:Uncharacterized protein n=1 Tax=Panicum virgatum TaxID=38727 RepID=A0A8T0SGA7_PANVG|nr:hypothetical protein PVAP13_5KG259400 [Panicum virgatum]